jgi:hypothetical protein
MSSPRTPAALDSLDYDASEPSETGLAELKADLARSFAGPENDREEYQCIVDRARLNSGAHHWKSSANG